MQYNKLDIKPGQIFGRLTIIGEDEQKGYIRYFLCRCDCGSEKEIALTKLRQGHTQSCGCFMRQRAKECNFKHGLIHTRLYNIWSKMKDRCLNPTSKHFKWYGKRGIVICNKWFDFLTFYTWALTNGYKDNLTIERIDNNGNYEPSNCTWIKASEQQKNRNCCNKIIYRGKTQNITAWAKEFGLARNTLYNRLKGGMPINEAFTKLVKYIGIRTRQTAKCHGEDMSAA